MFSKANEFSVEVVSNREEKVELQVDRNAKPMITEIGPAVEVVQSGTWGGYPDGWTGYYRY